MVRNGDHKVVIVRISILKELLHGCPFSLNLVGHALTEIQNQSNGNGTVILGEILDLLFLVSLIKLEVVLPESGDCMVHGVRDRDRYDHQVHIDSESIPANLHFLRWVGNVQTVDFRWRWVDRSFGLRTSRIGSLGVRHWRKEGQRQKGRYQESKNCLTEAT